MAPNWGCSLCALHFRTMVRRASLHLIAFPRQIRKTRARVINTHKRSEWNSALCETTINWQTMSGTIPLQTMLDCEQARWRTCGLRGSLKKSDHRSAREQSCILPSRLGFPDRLQSIDDRVLQRALRPISCACAGSCYRLFASFNTFLRAAHVKHTPDHQSVSIGRLLCHYRRCLRTCRVLVLDSVSTINCSGLKSGGADVATCECRYPTLVSQLELLLVVIDLRNASHGKLPTAANWHE